jgi:hypothetical protein
MTLLSTAGKPLVYRDVNSAYEELKKQAAQANQTLTNQVNMLTAELKALMEASEIVVFENKALKTAISGHIENNTKLAKENKRLNDLLNAVAETGNDPNFIANSNLQDRIELRRELGLSLPDHCLMPKQITTARETAVGNLLIASAAMDSVGETVFARDLLRASEKIIESITPENDVMMAKDGKPIDISKIEQLNTKVEVYKNNLPYTAPGTLTILNDEKESSTGVLIGMGLATLFGAALSAAIKPASGVRVDDDLVNNETLEQEELIKESNDNR